MPLQQNVASPHTGSIPVTRPLRQLQAALEEAGLLRSTPPTTPPGAKPISPKNYKSIPLQVNSQHKVFVSYAETGPELFAVQLVSEAKTLQHMMADINRRPHSSLVEPPIIGSVCLGRMSGDRTICRATVVNHSGSQCNLFFVDFGDTEMVSFYDIFDIPKEYVKINVLAMRFCLSGVKQLEKGPLLNEAFKELVCGKVLILKVVRPEGSPLIQYGELYLRDENILDLLKEKMRTKLQLKQLGVLPTGVKHSVLVSYVHSCIQFYIQLSDRINELDALMESVNAHCENSSSPGELAVGAPCCARFPADRTWYRAQVTDTKGSKIVVAYVDYGNELEVPVSELRTITPELLGVPAIAMKCALKGFENIPVEMKASNQLAMLTIEKTFMCYVVGALSSDTMLVTLVDDSVVPPRDVSSKLNQLLQPWNQKVKASTPIRKESGECFSSPEGGVGYPRSFQAERRPRDGDDWIPFQPSVRGLHSRQHSTARAVLAPAQRSPRRTPPAHPAPHSASTAHPAPHFANTARAALAPAQPALQLRITCSPGGSVPEERRRGYFRKEFRDSDEDFPDRGGSFRSSRYKESSSERDGAGGDRWRSVTFADMADRSSPGGSVPEERRRGYFRKEFRDSDEDFPDRGGSFRSRYKESSSERDGAGGDRRRSVTFADMADRSSPGGSVPEERRRGYFRKEFRDSDEDFPDRGGSFRSRYKESSSERDGAGGDRRRSVTFADMADRSSPGGSVPEERRRGYFRKEFRDSDEDFPDRGGSFRSRYKESSSERDGAGGDRRRSVTFADMADRSSPGGSVPEERRRGYFRKEFRDSDEDFPDRGGSFRSRYKESSSERDGAGGDRRRSVTFADMADRSDIFNQREKRDDWGNRTDACVGGARPKQRENLTPRGRAEKTFEISTHDKSFQYRKHFGNRDKIEYGNRDRNDFGNRVSRSARKNLTPRGRAEKTFDENKSDKTFQSQGSGDEADRAPLKQVHYKKIPDPVPLETPFANPAVELGAEHEVSVTWIYSPESFYTQILSLQPKFLEMMHKIPILYTGVRAHSGAVPVGASVLARYPADGVLYRATVLSLQLFSKLVVRYVDFGNKQLVDAADIWQLDRQLMALPKMAVHCALLGVAPAHSEWNVDARIDPCFNAPRFQCVFQDLAEAQYRVVLRNDGVSVADTLISKQLAVPSAGNHSEVTLKDEPIDMTIIVGQQLLCSVTHVERHDLFTVQLDLEKAARIEETISTYDLTKLKALAAELVAADKPWMVQREGRVCRVVLRDVPDPARVTALLAHIGTVITTDMHNVTILQVMVLPGELRVYYYQALQCTLHNYSPDSQHLLSLDQLKEKLTGNQFIVHVNDVDGITLVATLYEVSTGAKVQIFSPDEGAQEVVVPLCARVVFNATFGRAYVSHVVSFAELYLQRASDTDRLALLLDNLYNFYQEGNPEPLTTFEAKTLCAANSADGNWYRGTVLSADGDQVKVHFTDYGNSETVAKDSLRKLDPKFHEPCSLALVASLGMEALREDALAKLLEWTTEKEVQVTLSRGADGWLAALRLDEVDLGMKLVEEELAAPQPAAIAGDLSCFTSHVNSPSEFWIQLESAVAELQAMEAALVDADSFPELAARAEGLLCTARYPEDGAWYRAQVLVDGSEGTEVLFVDFGNASIVTDLRALPDELKAKPALARKCALQKPRDIKSWSRYSELAFNELADEGATMFTVQFVASGDISIVELYSEGDSVSERLVGMCERQPSAERSPSFPGSERNELDNTCHNEYLDSTKQPTLVEVLVDGTDLVTMLPADTPADTLTPDTNLGQSNISIQETAPSVPEGVSLERKLGDNKLDELLKACIKETISEQIEDQAKIVVGSAVEAPNNEESVVEILKDGQSAVETPNDEESVVEILKDGQSAVETPNDEESVVEILKDGQSAVETPNDEESVVEILKDGQSAVETPNNEESELGDLKNTTEEKRDGDDHDAQDGSEIANSSKSDLYLSTNSTNSVIGTSSFEAQADSPAEEVTLDEGIKTETPSTPERDVSSDTLETSHVTIQLSTEEQSRDPTNNDTGYTSGSDQDKSSNKDAGTPKKEHSSEEKAPESVDAKQVGIETEVHTEKLYKVLPEKVMAKDCRKVTTEAAPDASA